MKETRSLDPIVNRSSNWFEDESVGDPVSVGCRYTCSVSITIGLLLMTIDLLLVATLSMVHLKVGRHVRQHKEGGKRKIMSEIE